jgi:gamma-glutamyltranspeptidase/glutathione hydrolase/leukotriene-C4 hydrolase
LVYFHEKKRIFDFSFGSKVLGPETGIFYNDEMDDFSTPNTTNHFGVPASPANFIAPGKRPVSSMSPLILLENANQRIQQVLGASGGTRITTSVAQSALFNLWFNENIKQSIDAPRLHSQLLPQEVLAEQGFNAVRTFNSENELVSNNFFVVGYSKTIETTRS